VAAPFPTFCIVIIARFITIDRTVTHSSIFYRKHKVCDKTIFSDKTIITTQNKSRF